MERPSPRGATAAGARPGSVPGASPNRCSPVPGGAASLHCRGAARQPRLWAAGPRPSACAPFRAHSRHPLFPAKPAGALGPRPGPALGGPGRPPPAGPLTRPEPSPAQPVWVLLSAPWAAGPLAGRLAEAAALSPEPPLRQAPHSGLASLLGLQPHLGCLLSSTFAFHPSLSPAVLALQARKKRTKAKKDKAQRK